MKKLILVAFCFCWASFAGQTVHAQDDAPTNQIPATNTQTPTTTTGPTVNAGVPGGQSTPSGQLNLQTRGNDVEAIFGQGSLIGSTAGSAGQQGGGPAAPGGGGGGRTGPGRAISLLGQQLQNFQQNTQNQRIIRAPLRLGFIYVRQPVAQIAAKTNVRFRSLPRFQNSNIQIGFDQGVAILKGSVKSANDKRMAEMVAMFEPGVDKVKNEIVVRSN